MGVEGIFELTNEKLLRLPREGEEPKYQPNLAERWEMSADGLTWNLYLRQGIQFQEGWDEFTAEDVLFSALEVSKVGSVSGDASIFRIGAGIESYEIVNPYHFRMHLTRPNMEMERMLAMGELSMVSKRYYETVGHAYAIQNPIGTAPWRLIEHKPAEFMRYEAVENHWRKTPEFKYLKVVGIPELSAQLAMLKTGAADFVGIPSDRKAEVEAAGLHTKTRPGAASAAVLLGGMVLPTRAGFDPTVPWAPHQDEPEALADHTAGFGKVTGGSEWNQRALKVRMALTYSINVDAIIDVMFYGDAVKGPFGAAGNWAPFGSPLNRPEWEPMPYDPALAKQLLEEAGYANGFEKPIRFLIYESELFPLAGQVAEAVARDWEAIGLTVNREMVEYIVQRPWFAARESAWMVKLNFYGPFEEPWSGGVHYTTISYNEAYNDGFESLDIDVLLDNAATTLDYDERQEVIRELGDYYWPRYIIPPIVITSRVFALSAKVGDIPVGVEPMTYVWGNFEYATHAD